LDKIIKKLDLLLFPQFPLPALILDDLHLHYNQALFLILFALHCYY
jgi:hypothetical protein